MSEIVERVARATSCRRHARYELAPPWWSEDGPQPPDTILLTEDEKSAFREDARAAIEAMRAPTEAMVRAACRMWIEADYDEMAGLGRMEPDKPCDEEGPASPGIQSVWRAMIAAALEA